MRSCRPAVLPLVTVAVVFAALALSVPQSAMADEDDAIHALYVTGGGRWHDYEAQQTLVTEGLNRRLDIEWTIEHEPHEAPEQVPGFFLRDDWIEPFDVVVYNMCFSAIEDAGQAERFARAHIESGVPAVLLHCAIHSFRHATDAWFEFAGIVSQRHEDHRPFTVENREPAHPIMREFGDEWRTPEGELYVIERVLENTVVLAEAFGEDTEQHHAVIWAREHRNVRVFGTTIGHHNDTMAHPAYLDFVARGLRWAVRDLDD